MNNSDIAQIRLFLAQDGGAAAPPPAGETMAVPGGEHLPAPDGQAPQGGFPMWVILLPLFLIVMMMIFSGGAQKKERRRRAEMLAALAKHDKVQTVGGMIGTVVEIKDGEIVLKIDEANNTKVRFAKSAVQRVLADNAPVEVS